jgi:hypothetical protein
MLQSRAGVENLDYEAQKAVRAALLEEEWDADPRAERADSHR